MLNDFMFSLHPQLASDTFFVSNLKISRLLLMNDSNYPWLILVPQKPDLVELTDLAFEEQLEVLREINLIGKILKENFGAEKLNIAALGNMVKQLHIHVIGRFKNDATFPKPVWGNALAKAYDEKVVEEMIKKIQSLL
jgi:diadenosine tetraphosphate (Ap4A) HIT family hydrolase